MFGSPNLTGVFQSNTQGALNLNLLAFGGTQSNSQSASNSANVTNVGAIVV